MTSDQQAIRDLIALWHTATAAGDVGTVLTLMDEEVLFLVAGQPPMNRHAFEKNLRQLLLTHRIESRGEVLEVEVSEDLAWSRSSLKVRVVPLDGKPPMDREGSVLSVFRRRSGGSWALFRDANLLTSV